MRKPRVFLLASLMLVMLCSFSSPVQPAQNQNAQTAQIAATEVQNLMMTDCMVAGLAWAEAFTAYMVTENYYVMTVNLLAQAYWFNEWLNCIK
jgi:hypothetical protein